MHPKFGWFFHARPVADRIPAFDQLIVDPISVLRPERIVLQSLIPWRVIVLGPVVSTPILAFVFWLYGWPWLALFPLIVVTALISAIIFVRPSSSIELRDKGMVFRTGRRAIAVPWDMLEVEGSAIVDVVTAAVKLPVHITDSCRPRLAIDNKVTATGRKASSWPVRFPTDSLMRIAGCYGISPYDLGDLMLTIAGAFVTGSPAPPTVRHAATEAVALPNKRPPKWTKVNLAHLRALAHCCGCGDSEADRQFEFAAVPLWVRLIGAGVEASLSLLICRRCLVRRYMLVYGIPIALGLVAGLALWLIGLATVPPPDPMMPDRPDTMFLVYVTVGCAVVIVPFVVLVAASWIFEPARARGYSSRKETLKLWCRSDDARAEIAQQAVK